MPRRFRRPRRPAPGRPRSWPRAPCQDGLKARELFQGRLPGVLPCTPPASRGRRCTRAVRAAGFEVHVVREAVRLPTIVGLVAAGPDVHGVASHPAWRRGGPDPAVRGVRSVAPRPGADAGRAGQGSNL
ncbi:hypothetical protein ACSNOI_08520 [Actinomadura kijaniata]